MEIKTYKNASKIEERYISDLALRQAECWWAKPFEEYRICNNRWCRAIFSTQEVLWDIMKIREIESSWSISFCCKECWDNTQEIYKKEEYIETMRAYLLWQVSALLLVDDNDVVEWFGVISKTTIRGVAELEFNTRPGSYEIEETIKKIWKVLYDDKNAEDKDVICFHQIYLSPLIRNADLSYQSLKALFEINREDYAETPTIWEAKYDNKFYPISRSIGFENIAHDAYWYVIQSIPNYSDVLNFLDLHEWYQGFLWEMIRFKRESRNILRKYPDITSRKFYK